MNNLVKRIIGIMLALVLFAHVTPSAAYTKSSKTVDCKTLCAAVLKATGGSKKLKYTSVNAMDFGGLSVSDRAKVKSMQYVCDAKEVYSVCVIETASSKHAKSIVNALKKYKKNNCSSQYLSDYSKAERKVFKNTIYGKKGCYVWYIAMSPKKAQNNKGKTAIGKKL